ncbi:MAG: cytochrome P460 family protein [Deltaproteobacteria bacterium]|nr:cytochrome P460 family protein [Deltaproteobacteria bacterium]
MKKHAIIFILSVAFFLGLTLSGTAGDMPAADGAKFWMFMTKTDPYTGWGYWPGSYGIKPGQSPHGAFITVYANGIALKAAREGKPMPEGAIIVKENYGPDKKTLMAVTPMYKIKGYNPSAGDWWWAKIGPDGKVMAEGKPQGCINCHQAVKDKDWIFTEIK